MDSECNEACMGRMDERGVCTIAEGLCGDRNKVDSLSNEPIPRHHCFRCCTSERALSNGRLR